MAIKIIDHKKVDLTDGEWRMYQNICRSYDDKSANRRGEDLFMDHFDVNEHGIIIFVRPPSKRYSSLEVFCFLISLMQNQHMRILYEQNKVLIKETRAKLDEIMKEVESLKKSVENQQANS